MNTAIDTELNPYLPQQGAAQDAVEMAAGQSNSIGEAGQLRSPLRLESGSIVTLLMRGHTHSPGGLEYFAPAVVLNQYNDEYGSIDALIWDAHAGAHFAHGYHVRELGVSGDGPARQMVELKSNVGEVLFSPAAFSQALQDIEQLMYDVRKLRGAVDKLIAGQSFAGAAAASGLSAPGAAGPAQVATSSDSIKPAKQAEQKK